jgi:AAA family ATP:ADP antiporter
MPIPVEANSSPQRARPHRLLDLRQGELSLVAWACAYFFFILSSYYCIRPVRDAFGLSGGDQELRWLFRTTLVVMIAVNPVFSWLVARFPRRKFILVSYLFFALNLLIFFLLFTATKEGEAAWARRTFYVWVSVFNLFIVSVFWGFMADLFTVEQSKRLYGLIAVGGTIGAMAGAGLAWLLARPLGAANMLPISITLLLAACLCMLRLNRLARRRRAAPGVVDAEADVGGEPEEVIGGSSLAGVTHLLCSPYLLGIGLFILLYTILGTLLYFRQADIVRDAFTSDEARTAFFSKVAFLSNSLTVLIQIFLTGRVLRSIGVGLTLALLPIVHVIGFGVLGASPTLIVLVSFVVGRQASNYALARPARESLFTVLEREEKYKAKNLIDTFIYRAGDAIGTARIGFLAIPLAVVWFILALLLGRRQKTLARKAAAR